MGGLAASLGEWALALPGGPVAARRAAAAFVEFAALPTAGAPVSCACAPVSPAEKSLAAQPPALQVSTPYTFEVKTVLQVRMHEPCTLTSLLSLSDALSSRRS